MSNKNPPNYINPPPELIEAINKILRQFVKLLLRCNIAFPKAAELLRKAYVSVAEEDFTLDDKPQTDARLSLLTGIDRKKIKSLRNQGGEKEKAPEGISAGLRLVSRWVTESKYLNDDGTPLALPLKGKAEEPSFESLVQEVLRQDIRPKVILDEWLNKGAVSLSQDNTITLDAQAYIPSKVLDEKAYFFGRNISDHLAAGTHNLIGEKAAFFDRFTFYDSLSDDSIKTLEKLAKERGTDILRELNELAMSLRLKDMAKKDNKHRIHIGLFVYHEPEESKK